MFRLAHSVHAPVVALKTAIRRRPLYKKELKESLTQLNNLKRQGKTIWFCGVPTHYNLGDQAQAVCIRKWIAENYDNYRIIELLAFPFYSKKFRDYLEKLVTSDDIFIIQSGYCTSDKHYNHFMHRYIVEHYKQPVLFMPQTVNFYNKKQGYKTGEIYAKHEKMLFLARDKKSKELATEYFKHTKILLYPDIVTCLIGTRVWDNKRNGVLLCVRNDGEKLYSSDQIERLIKRFQHNSINVDITDTNYSESEAKEGVESVIDEKLKQFASYQVIITDRFHGTIFSMIANTPVIVLATNDHKVKTGTEWFQNIYDGAFQNAESIDEAYSMALRILRDQPAVHNSSYFKEHYYDKLYSAFEGACK